MVDTIVNSAFTTLRTLIPTEPVDRKLSKIETLSVLGMGPTHPVSANLRVSTSGIALVSDLPPETSPDIKQPRSRQEVIQQPGLMKSRLPTQGNNKEQPQQSAGAINFGLECGNGHRVVTSRESLAAP
uniref:BHLH domain-containing protein n=1 Tax=Timema tahoe TaxID=61484 RepID=A0A7R9IN08_9NEOP|nr:unnamed protein product [Timema tahoe]